MTNINMRSKVTFDKSDFTDVSRV